MTALVNTVIAEHIEYLADQAEYWQERQAQCAQTNPEWAAKCAEYAELAEQRAMVWAARMQEPMQLMEAA